MVNYIEYNTYLPKQEINKLSNATGAVDIWVSKNDAKGVPSKLALTSAQINKIEKSMGRVKLTLSKSQLMYMKKCGGFLPLLAGLIPALIGGVGALSSGIASAVNSSKQTAEQKRHNEAMENIAKGSGYLSDVVEPIPVVGPKLSSALKKIGLGGSVKGLKGQPGVEEFF